MATPGVYYAVKRGDVYYVRFDKGFGSEIAAGRPVVVVSDESLDKHFPMITCVYMTKTNRSQDGFGIELTTPRQKSWALCNQIYSFDSGRLTEYMCTLTEEEMERIDAGLALNLGLKLYDPETDRRSSYEREELEARHAAEIAELKLSHARELEAVRDEALGQLVDYDLCKRKYEYAMERLTTLIVGKDTIARTSEAPVVVEEPMPVVIEAPVVVEEPVVIEEEEDPLVDINRCTLGDLCELGFPMATAKMIVAARPYLDVDDLRGVPGVTRIGYQLVESRITVGDTAEFRKKPEPKQKSKKFTAMPVDDRVNVNTATWQELVERAGFNSTTAKHVVAYRNKWGKFGAVEELLNVSRFGKVCLKKYGERLTV